MNFSTTFVKKLLNISLVLFSLAKEKLNLHICYNLIILRVSTVIYTKLIFLVPRLK